MKQITSAQFRRSYRKLDEPTEVLLYLKVVGTWYPAGTEMLATSEQVDMSPKLILPTTTVEWDVPFGVEFRPVRKK